jgi:mannose-6-phosphate isomerase-like protein (cupin superfamily)
MIRTARTATISRIHGAPATLTAVLLIGTWRLAGADPTFLRRSVAGIDPRPDDLTAGAVGVSYQPIFGAGDPQANQLKSVARYGLLKAAPGGSSAMVNYPAEEQIYFVLAGQGTLVYAGERAALRRNDFAYLPPGVKHGITNSSGEDLRVLVMGFRIPRDVKVPPTPRLMQANADDVQPVTLEGHGPDCRFKLLMGTTASQRDKLAAASQMVSLFIMDFAPGGTNIPHHHEMAEEIYYVLRGKGEMVAGGGADGDEGRYPAREGEVYFIRLNATVGFYSGARPGEEHDLVLAVRSRFPFPKPEP